MCNIFGNCLCTFIGSNFKLDGGKKEKGFDYRLALGVSLKLSTLGVSERALRPKLSRGLLLDQQSRSIRPELTPFIELSEKSVFFVTMYRLSLKACCILQKKMMQYQQHLVEEAITPSHNNPPPIATTAIKWLSDRVIPQMSWELSCFLDQFRRVFLFFLLSTGLPLRRFTDDYQKKLLYNSYQADGSWLIFFSPWISLLFNILFSFWGYHWGWP